jgi:hypothetical protein
MFVIAHRGNLKGKAHSENNIFQLRQAVARGFGVELDVRRAEDTNALIISHEPSIYRAEISAALVLKRLGNAFIALNIKQSGLLQDLYQIKPELNGFVFDFELCCKDSEQEIGAYTEVGYKIARRYSDRGESPAGKCDYIWFDEMDNTGSLNINVIDVSKTIYVSPELHGRNIETHRIEGFWGVCTDYCDFYG